MTQQVSSCFPGAEKAPGRTEEPPERSPEPGTGLGLRDQRGPLREALGQEALAQAAGGPKEKFLDASICLRIVVFSLLVLKGNHQYWQYIFFPGVLTKWKYGYPSASRQATRGTRGVQPRGSHTCTRVAVTFIFGGSKGARGRAPPRLLVARACHPEPAQLASFGAKPGPVDLGADAKGLASPVCHGAWAHAAKPCCIRSSNLGWLGRVTWHGLHLKVYDFRQTSGETGAWNLHALRKTIR